MLIHDKLTLTALSVTQAGRSSGSDKSPTPPSEKKKIKSVDVIHPLNP